MIRTMCVAAAIAAGLTAVPTAAVTATDPAGDYLSDYVGPQNGDLDVLDFSVSIVGSNFVLSSTMDGPVGTTAGGIYVWGVNRGHGLPGFGASLGLDKVLFDSVVVLQPAGTGTVVLLPGGPTPLAAGSVVVSGNTITGTVPIALLPSNGFAADRYGFNLWPRIGGGTVTNIADFAPDNATVRVAAVPEPASWALLVVGFGLIGGSMRRGVRPRAA